MEVRHAVVVFPVAGADVRHVVAMVFVETLHKNTPFHCSMRVRGLQSGPPAANFRKKRAAGDACLAKNVRYMVY